MLLWCHILYSFTCCCTCLTVLTHYTCIQNETCLNIDYTDMLINDLWPQVSHEPSYLIAISKQSSSSVTGTCPSFMEARLIISQAVLLKESAK
ncbi:hypothetical protein PoB_007349200 [Plakobranchus ocellatus]|uniref:Secreted protein n=1 Tax=Plakobranchus ocellatus TaxID=259542 RepID=A0AAV4DSH6_9GAST|nr:hypothetical protein PoB_007349200 [Plakobranchus ocellatus]